MDTTVPFGRRFARTLLAGAIAVTATGSVRATPEGPADWVAIDLGRIAWGRGGDVQVVSRGPERVAPGAFRLDGVVSGAVLAGERLYVVEHSRGAARLLALAIDEPDARPVAVSLSPAPVGMLRIAQMDDFLLVAEAGHGLRVLQLAAHRHHAGADHAEPLRQVGLLPWSQDVEALAVSLRTAYVAARSDILVLDLGDPAEPRLERRVAVGTTAVALAANGATLHLLGTDGLHVLDLSAGHGLRRLAFDADVRGRALVAAGRELHVAAGDSGLRVLRDEARQKATFFIQVGDTFFNPPAVEVAVGDTVRWQKGSTSFTHNVRSCTAAQLGCDGEVATESFLSGGVTTAPFDFSHVFASAGSNPYVCQTHAFTMSGSVTVAAPSAPPPAVPDGTGAEPPMTVERLTVDGSDLRLVYDTSCADAVERHILFGTGAQLPAVPGGTFGTSGATCGIGGTVPFDWIGSPAALPDEFVWWLIVAGDGEGVEGSWGKDGAGAERIGPGLDGASNRCGNGDKDLTNACGQ